MSRKVLDPSRIHPKAAAGMAAHAGTIAEVEKAIATNRVVVVGMAQNPHVKRARRTLDDAKIAFTYLEYGSYLSGWKPRLAIKQWSGWPTFPQVFVDGVLLGGADTTKEAIADGTLKTLLDSAAPVANA